MRTFEVILIVVNLLSLFPTFRQQSKAVWLWTGGINLSAFFVHGRFEGFRYQMVFSYIFVTLLVVITLVKTVSNFRAKTPKVLNVTALSISFVLLLFTSFLAYALPVFTLPKPTGSSDVGITYLHLIDENHTDSFLNRTTKKRELMVKIYYPAKQDDSKPFSPYFHNSPELLRLLTTGYGMPSLLCQRSSSVC
jgi:hypothetical protein